MSAIVLCGEDENLIAGAHVLATPHRLLVELEAVGTFRQGAAFTTKLSISSRFSRATATRRAAGSRQAEGS
jgi:hypothetical protein